MEACQVLPPLRFPPAAPVKAPPPLFPHCCQHPVLLHTTPPHTVAAPSHTSTSCLLYFSCNTDTFHGLPPLCHRRAVPALAKALPPSAW